MRVAEDVGVLFPSEKLLFAIQCTPERSNFLACRRYVAHHSGQVTSSSELSTDLYSLVPAVASHEAAKAGVVFVSNGFLSAGEQHFLKYLFDCDLS